MNVKDVSSKIPFVAYPLQDIFAKQRELMKKYEVIEKNNGLLQTDLIPVELDSNKGQARLKDFFWRITEEIAEALEAFEEGSIVHFQEEIADALHFLVEACILAGWPSEISLEKMFDNCPYTVDSDFDCLVKPLALDFIVNLGLAANCLKNKPWKQSHMQTDRLYFYCKMTLAFQSFINFCNVSGFTCLSLYGMYFKKNQVNQFRQRSQY